MAFETANGSPPPSHLVLQRLPLYVLLTTRIHFVQLTMVLRLHSNSISITGSQCHFSAGHTAPSLDHVLPFPDLGNESLLTPMDEQLSLDADSIPDVESYWSRCCYYR